MRPIYPGRNTLLTAIRSLPTLPSRLPRDGPHPFLLDICSRAGSAGAVGDADAVAALASEASNAPDTVDPDVAVRIVTLNALYQSVFTDETGQFAENIVTALTASGVLAAMRRSDVSQILDLMTRAMAARGDVSGAFRIESLSRLLEVSLRRGTYTALIRLVSVDASGPGILLSLGVFHRALVVGKAPNIAMFNALLDACLVSRDGVRARAVLAEMEKEKIPVNGDTLSILLANANAVANVDTVFQLLQSQVSGMKLYLTPGMALPFLRAYIAAGKGGAASESAESSDRKLLYVEKCFTIVDWFYSQNVGVTNECLDLLVAHLGESGNAEGSLHAWREMRRGWLGIPSRRGRRALVQSVAASTLPSRLDKVVWPRLRSVMTEREKRRLRRVVLSTSDAGDAVVLDSRPAGVDSALDAEIGRDQAAVLHRWCAEGRRGDVMDWITAVLKRDGRVDSRVLLAALSIEHDFSVERGDDLCPLQFVLNNLQLVTRPVDSVDRDNIVNRAADAVWCWANNSSMSDEESCGELDEYYVTVDELIPSVAK